MTTTEGATDAPLWDDNTIITVYQRAFGRPPDVHHMALMCWIRDEMLAQAEQYVQKNDHLHSTCTEFAERIADLEAQLAQLSAPAASGEWVPVEDGDYTFDEWEYTQAIAVHNGELSVYVGGTEVARLKLGDMRLCQRTPAPALPQALVPQWEREFPPEWDRHPWANYACLIVMHSVHDGVTLMWNYWEVEPEWGKKSYNWVDGKHGYMNPVKRAPLSTFFNTRETLRQRPAAQAQDEVSDVAL